MAESKPNKEVSKAETISNRDVVRPPTARERGQPRIVTSSRFVQDARDRDLAMPQRLCVFDTMYQTEEAIYNSVDVTNVPTLYALTNGKAVAGPSNSSASKAAADFINYNIRNMSSGTWAEAMNNMLTDIIYGWSFLNIVTERRNHGQYAGMRCLRKLAPRSQHSLYGWVWDKDFREPLGFVQRPNRIQNRNPRIADFEANISINQLINSTSFQQNYPYLRKEQLLHSRYNPINTNPQGDSPLLHCYESYTEKQLIEKYELIGVSKDLGGSIVLRVPSDLIQKANDPTNYPEEAAEYRQLQEDASALQAGEQTHILLSSDVDPETKIRDFDLEFKGIDGGLI